MDGAAVARVVPDDVIRRQGRDVVEPIWPAGKEGEQRINLRCQGGVRIEAAAGNVA